MFRIELVFHYHQLAQTGQGSLKPCGYEAKLTPAPENCQRRSKIPQKRRLKIPQ